MTDKLTQEELERMRKVVGGIGDRLNAPAPKPTSSQPQQSINEPFSPVPPQQPAPVQPQPAQPQQPAPVQPQQAQPQQPAPVQPQPAPVQPQPAQPQQPAPVQPQPAQQASNEPFPEQAQDHLTQENNVQVNDPFIVNQSITDTDPVDHAFPTDPVDHAFPTDQSGPAKTIESPENLFAAPLESDSDPHKLSQPAALSTSDDMPREQENLFQASSPVHQQPSTEQPPSEQAPSEQPPAEQVSVQQNEYDTFPSEPGVSEPEPQPGSSQLLKSNLPQNSDQQDNSAAPLPEPKDILMAIAIDDPRLKEDMINRSALSQMKDNTIIPTSKKARKKVSLEPLAFDQLKPGTPLIATIYSPSGGVGKSSTSMNLGVYIAAVAATMAKKKAAQGQENIRVPRVLTLDGDIDMGSLLLRLTGRLEPNIYDLLTYIDEREEQGFEGPAAWPKSYDNPPAGEKGMSSFVHWLDKLPNFNVLGAAKEPDLFWDFGPADYRNILKMLGKFYDVIIIDAGINVILESQRSWLAHANEVFLITAPDIDRIFNAAKTSRYIAQRRAHPQDTRDNAPILPALVTSDKLSVVMTRCDADAGIDLEENVKYFFPWLRDDQKFWIPDVSTEMTQANNSSRFLVLENPEYAKVISKMAKRVFQRYITTSKQRSLPSAEQGD
jgi:MinD-like ATPase involved in chromosome partitioning or flagellar assembly